MGRRLTKELRGVILLTLLWQSPWTCLNQWHTVPRTGVQALSRALTGVHGEAPASAVIAHRMSEHRSAVSVNHTDTIRVGCHVRSCASTRANDAVAEQREQSQTFLSAEIKSHNKKWTIKDLLSGSPMLIKWDSKSPLKNFPSCVFPFSLSTGGHPPPPFFFFYSCYIFSCCLMPRAKQKCSLQATVHMREYSIYHHHTHAQGHTPRKLHCKRSQERSACLLLSAVCQDDTR